MKTRTTVCSFAALAALFGSAAAAGPLDFPGGPRYDGTVKVLSFSGATCPATQLNAKLSAVYRIKANSKQIPEAISVVISSPVEGAVILKAENDGTLAGKDQKVSGSFILDAYANKLPTSKANLKFTPASLQDAPDTFKFTGTISNYFVQGCTAKVRGNFAKRPTI